MAKRQTRKTQRKKQTDAKNEGGRSASQPASKGTSSDLPHQEVACRAHQIWLDSGCQPNNEQTHWLEAERQLRAERRSENPSQPSNEPV